MEDYRLEIYKEKELDMINKLINKIDNLIDQITITFFIMFLLFGAYALYDAHVVNSSAKLSKDILNLRPKENQESQFSLNPLKEINPDICAWIRINDTNIDYPIVRGKDNTEYLNRNYKKEYSTAGSLFLDYRNENDFKDDYSIVYGHNMKSNYMFSDIKKFDNAEFFEQHKVGTLYTENEVYKLEIFCVARVSAFSNDIYNLVIYKNGKTDELINTFNSNASFKRALEFTGNDKLILLSTCSSSGSNDRLVLVARLVKFNAESDEDGILINEDAETILQNAENKKDKKEEEFKPYENKDSNNNKKKFRLRISTRTLVIRILEFIVAIIFAIVIIQRIKLIIKKKRKGKNKVEKKEEEQNKEVKNKETESKKEKGKNKKITEIREKIGTKVPKIMLGIKDKLSTIAQKAVTGIKKLGHILKRGVIGLKNKLVHMMQKAIIGIKKLGHLVKRVLVRIKNKLSHMVQKIITGIKNKVKRNDKTEEKTKEKNKDKTEKKVEEKKVDNKDKVEEKTKQDKKAEDKAKTEKKTEVEKKVENKNNTKNKKKKKK